MGRLNKTDSLIRNLSVGNAPVRTDFGNLVLPNNSGEHVKGLKREDPVEDYDLANKGYVDEHPNQLITDNLSIGYTETSETVAGSSVGIKLYVGIEGNDDLAGTWLDRHTNTAAYGSHIVLARSRGLTHAGATVVQDGDTLGQIYAAGYDGTDYALSSSIEFEVDDATPAATDMGGAIVFKTSTAGTETLIEQFRIQNDGITVQLRNAGYGHASTSATSNESLSLDNRRFQTIVLNGSYTITLSDPVNTSYQYHAFLKVKQDATGSRTITWAGNIVWPGGVEPTLSSGANDYDVLEFWWDGSNWMLVNAVFDLQ